MEKLQKLTLKLEAFVYKVINESSFDVNQKEYLKHLSNFFVLDRDGICSNLDDFKDSELVEVFELIEKYEDAYIDFLAKNGNLKKVQIYKKLSFAKRVLEDYEKFVNSSILDNSFDLEKNVKYLNKLFHIVKDLDSKNIEKTIELIELFHASNIKRLKPTKS